MTTITNEAGLPEPIYKAVCNDGYSAGRSDITVTQLIQPPRKVELERRHAAEITEDASDRIWSLMGQVAHGILERAEGVMLAEQRLYTTVRGWTVGGQFDRCALIDGGSLGVVLQDYKVASIYEGLNGLKQDREDQLNLLAELARQNGYRVDALQAVLIYRDWSKTKAERGDHPPRQVAVFDVTLWSQESAQRFMDKRVQAHRAAHNADNLPACSPDERWERPTKYAVMKTGRKSAVKLHDDSDSAQKHAATISSAYVEKRPGESVRCKHYCAALPFCEVGRRLVYGKKQETADA